MKWEFSFPKDIKKKGVNPVEAWTDVPIIGDKNDPGGLRTIDI